MSSGEQARFDEAWSAVTGGVPVSFPEIVGRRNLESRLAVNDVAVACVATALMAGTALAEQRNGRKGRVVLDRGHVAAAVRSERLFQRGAESAGTGFAPFSRFWRAADGWVRTHANFPWHHDALLQALEADDTHESVSAAIAARTAEDIEAAVFASGGVAAAVRTADRWRAHPQGQAIASEPLVSHEVVGAARPRYRDASDLPAEGLRVLDLTRVIAGPVCTRYLAALGADVLRIDPPHRPDMADGVVADTLLGKRSAIVDARTERGAATLRDLAASADVVVCGYRPGALEQLGLDPQTLADHNAGVAVVILDAWGHTGPWRGRRGFDSVVQAPTGIAVAEAGGHDEPGSLPCQLLDHGTGYLAAAAVLDSVRRQAVDGGTHVRRLSLARTAAWLIASPPGVEADQPGDDDGRWRAELPFEDGPVIAVRPPGELFGKPLFWPATASRYGGSPPHWSS